MIGLRLKVTRAATGIFDQSLYQRLFRDFTCFGCRRPPYEEPFARAVEEPPRFERLCCRALAEGAVSGARTPKSLGVPVQVLHRRMDAPPTLATSATV